MPNSIGSTEEGSSNDNESEDEEQSEESSNSGSDSDNGSSSEDSSEGQEVTIFRFFFIAPNWQEQLNYVNCFLLKSLSVQINRLQILSHSSLNSKKEFIFPTFL